jgi:predicted DNA-binding protein (UPF0251 family)
MAVSRATFGRLLASARRKTVDALLHAKALQLPAFVPETGAEALPSGLFTRKET